MLGDISASEIELLNSYQILGPGLQRELKEYTRYLLTRQYRRESMVAVFHNRLINNLFHSLLYMVEKDDFDFQQVRRRVMQIKELYYGIFEQVHTRYSELVEDLDSNEIVREFGRNSFENLEGALKSSNHNLIRMEVIEFYQEFGKLAKKKDARQIVAV
ncbi:hypothetical protein [Syntrophomonas erecta]